MGQPAGLIARESAHGVEETLRRFRGAAEAANLTIFAEVDHGGGAAGVGLELRPTRLIVFGNARGGTPLMQAAQTAGIDLPHKALVWEDERGRTWLAYNDPHWIADRHGMADVPAVDAMAEALAKLVAQAIG